MILSDAMLLAAIERGELRFDPPVDLAQQVQPASVDLRLGSAFRIFNYGNHALIDPREGVDLAAITELVELAGRPFILHPGAFVLGTTLEYVAIPTTLVGRLEGRSSIGRLGVIVHASLPYDAPVLFRGEDGVLGYRPIGELVEQRLRGQVVSFDPETFEVAYHEVTNWFRELPDTIYEVRLASGRAVHVTAGHNLFTLDAHGDLVKTPTRALAPGTHVAIPRRIPAPAGDPPVYRVLDLLADEATRDNLICHGPTVDALLRRREPEVRDLLQEGGLAPADWLRARKLPYRLLARLHGDTPPLGPGDRVAYKGARTSLPAIIQIDEEIAWLLGLYVAEGYRRRKQVTISNTDQRILDRAEAALRGLGQRVYRAPGAITCSSILLAAVFAGLGMGEGTPTKRLPTGALGWPAPLLESLLEGLIDGDGSVRPGRTCLWTTSRQLVSDTLHLAARLGRRAVSQGCRPRPRCQPAYTVSIATNEHKVLMAVPLPSALLTDIRLGLGLSQARASRLAGYTHATSLNNIEKRHARDAVRLVTLTRLHETYAALPAEPLAPLDKLTRLVQGDLLWDEVVEVVDTGRFETVYDLEVRPGGAHIENFLAGHGGVFVSNTAGFVDPGFEGTITLEISNAGKIPVALHPGMRICQLTLLETGPVLRPYGVARGSKYQGQRDPTPSRIAQDAEFGTRTKD
ncbi:MAG TPA: dCTP deaminase [Thermomicrobiales bacterium]|nr:dCTP deaminase [Thermomicrobiales bacterium]